MSLDFESMTDFEFRAYGYGIDKLNGEYVMQGGLQDVLYHYASKFKRRLSIDQLLQAFSEKGNIFDAKTPHRRDYFFVVTRDAAYIVLGNSLLYDSTQLEEVPILKITGIDSERDSLILRLVSGEEINKVSRQICAATKSYTRQVAGMQRALKSKKDETIPSMPWQ
ncbi:hypothetical protein KY310_03065 [Candidatus Woesearchaeota archaeon]|nr:hypothetical protein [Candidatus Woesearchaeota archaeon]